MNENLIDIGSEIRMTNNTPLDVTSTPNITMKTNFGFALPSGNCINNQDETKYILTTKLGRDHYTVSSDHCYARPWNWRPETNFLRSSKTLFVDKPTSGTRKSSNPLISLQNSEEYIDILSETEVPTALYNFEKAKALVDECQKYALNARLDRNEEDWEEKISKLNWTSTQNRIFSGMVNILNSLKLAELAGVSANNEPLTGYLVIKKAVQRVRRLLATITWDQKLIQWLHQLLMENLDHYYLACYIEILQVLKSKLPAFVEKMMHISNPTSRVGPSSNPNFTQLLDKSWDSIFTLVQDKPKKLPGNPVIVLVPAGPFTSKMANKWIKLLSNLANVFTVTTNFGQCLSSFNPKCSTGHRMTLPNCIDHMFSLTRGKIQDVKVEYPGRNIVLVGFNAGATLALQVAQVESVFCVVSLGFSLQTAEGRRGEPEDTLLELQCPVLFVIGQRSNTSFQEDLEDLRERMRVETGLVVVGSADNYLRVSKKKRKMEGITQAIVDKYIIDEVGDFISGLILSPYPPQIKQLPSVVPFDSALKKPKIERTRYNSNASSVESEPPSPTARITRPVGRPPGSKSKSRLEAKWAQQIAQGNTTDPTSPKTTTPPPTITTNDTPTNDNLKIDKQISTQLAKISETPAKKLKTLKPVGSPNKSASMMVKTTPHTARLQAYGLNKSIIPGGTLSTLLQGGIKTIPPSQPKCAVSGIKVLENVTLNSCPTKLIPNKTMDLSKLTVVNPTKCNSTNVGNVYILPDGKLKTVQSGPVKETSGGTPLMVPIGTQRNQIRPTSRNKYITTKRQLMGQRPPRPVKTSIYMPNTSIQTSLPPPTNLTSQDIMDLPIIFADDNKILEPNTSSKNSNNTAPPISTSESLPTPKVFPAITSGKYMLVNKNSASPSNFIITSAMVKKQNPITFSKPPPKYTKIILSSKKHNLEELKPIPKLQNFNAEISVKKVTPQEHVMKDSSCVELIDLENEIKATAVPKPNVNSDKNIINSKSVNKDMLITKPDVALIMKRPLTDETDDGDPDYIPPKNLKLQ